MDEDAFIKRTHWYANWRYDYALYREIFAFTQDNRIRLIALNIPFHLPPKIAIGGIDSLLEEDRTYLPEKIDTTIVAHREYVHKVFQNHRIRGREDFDHFYAAQCVWEDTMAETIAGLHEPSKIVVLAGNGHIYQKFGIPQRAFNRTGDAYRTIYPVATDGDPQLTDADYLWITPKPERRQFHRFSRPPSR